MSAALRVIDVPLRFARCQLVLGDAPTLVDAGTRADVPRILDALARAGLAPRDLRRIILTHGDGDHAGGAAALQELTGAEVAAGRAEAGYLGGTLPAGFGLVKRAIIALAGRAPQPEVARWLDGGERLDGIEVLATPGHTPGHLSLLAGDVLLAGDAFSTGNRCAEVPRLMSADVPGSRAAIRALAEREREVRRAFSGHGPPIDDAGRRLRALAARLR